MATKQVLLKDLKVGELKKELKERDMDTGGKKTELQEKLRLALIEEGDDPDKILFKVPGILDMSAVLEKMEENSKKMEENSRSLEEKMEENSKSEDTNRRRN